MKCRTYVLSESQLGAADRRPSPHYLDIIIKGAEEHKLPDYYIKKLHEIEHNGFTGSISFYDDIMARHNTPQPCDTIP